MLNESFLPIISKTKLISQKVIIYEHKVRNTKHILYPIKALNQRIENKSKGPILLGLRYSSIYGTAFDGIHKVNHFCLSTEQFSFRLQ